MENTSGQRGAMGGKSINMGWSIMLEPQRHVGGELRTEGVLTYGNVKVFCDPEGLTSQKPDCTELHRKWEVKE